jgi:lipoic acid synthetase
MTEKDISNHHKPAWLKIKLPEGKNYLKVKGIVEKYNLHTICVSGKCPNIADCWGRNTATFMILGDICTRSCRFCAVKTGKPEPVDWDEPMRIAKSVKLMELKHCVITSVDRDDLEDGGAELWAETIRTIKKVNPNTTIEVLIPDFGGKYENLEKIVKAKPNVISHNLETVRRISPKIRNKAEYDRSLRVIENITLASSGNIISKSGIMVGIGETEKEVFETMDDLRKVDCRVFTIGQYLQPTKKQLSVYEYITPKIFEKYRKTGLEKGFEFVESAPLVRSSYHAEKHVACNVLSI